MLWTRRARPASGCRRRSLGVETTSASCARRGGTCWEMVAVDRFQRRHPFCTAVRSGYLLRIAACYKYLVHGTGTWYHTWYAWPPYNRKKRNACFYMEPRIRFYTRTRKFKNEVTNRWEKGPFLNLKKYCIRNSLRLLIAHCCRHSTSTV